MEKLLLAYAYDSGFTGVSDEDAKKLTHLNYSFALIKDDEAVVSHWKKEAELLAFMEKHKHITVCLSIGGWCADGFSQAVGTEAGRQKLASSLIGIVKKYNFKGVDLDWEYPCDSVSGIASSPDDKGNFTLFIKLLRKALNELEEQTSIHYLLTMAVGANQKCASNLEFDKMIDCMDYIYLMTYDMSPWDGVTGHHTHLFQPTGTTVNRNSGSTTVDIYNKAGVPFSKLVLGAAFYGRCYRNVERGDRNGLFQKHNGAPEGVKYSEIIDRLSKTAVRYFDDDAKAPYIYDESDKFFATYDDEESITHKTQFVKDRDLAGIMYWEYNGDKSGVLLDAMYKGLKEAKS